MSRSIQTLVRQYQDQQLTNEELKQLDELLRTDANAREIFIHETNLIAAIEDIACEQDQDLDVTHRVHPVSTDPSNASAGLSNRWIMATGWHRRQSRQYTKEWETRNI